MAAKLMNIIYTQNLAFYSCCSTYSFSHWDMHAGDFPLKRAKYQFIMFI